MYTLTSLTQHWESLKYASRPCPQYDKKLLAPCMTASIIIAQTHQRMHSRTDSHLHVPASGRPWVCQRQCLYAKLRCAVQQAGASTTCSIQGACLGVRVYKHLTCARARRQTASAVPVRPSRRAAEELGAALRLLARAVAALVAGHLGPAAARLPPDWSPFACLAGKRLLLLTDPVAHRAGRRGLRRWLCAC